MIISTRSRLETARLLADRIRVPLSGLELEIIVVSPAAEEQTNRMSACAISRPIPAASTRRANVGLRSSVGEYVWFRRRLTSFRCGDICEINSRAGAVDLLVALFCFRPGRIYRPSRTLLLLHFLNCVSKASSIAGERCCYRFFRRLPVQAISTSTSSCDPIPPSEEFLARPICIPGVAASGRDLG